MMRSIVYKALAYFSAFCLAAPTLLAGAETVQPAASPADTVAQSTGATPSYTEYSRKYTGIPAAAGIGDYSGIVRRFRGQQPAASR